MQTPSSADGQVVGGYDGSAASQRALVWAAALSHTLGDGLKIVHAVTWTSCPHVGATHCDPLLVDASMTADLVILSEDLADEETVPVSPTWAADMPSDFWKPDSDTIWISSPSRLQDTPSPKVRACCVRHVLTAGTLTPSGTTGNTYRATRRCRS